MIPIPQNTLWYDAVQIVLLCFLVASVIWQAIWLVKHSIRLTRIETVLFNHYQHRFKKLQKQLGIKWEDDLDDERDSVTS